MNKPSKHDFIDRLPLEVPKSLIGTKLSIKSLHRDESKRDTLKIVESNVHYVVSYRKLWYMIRKFFRYLEFGYQNSDGYRLMSYGVREWSSHETFLDDYLKGKFVIICMYPTEFLKAYNVALEHGKWCYISGYGQVRVKDVIDPEILKLIPHNPLVDEPVFIDLTQVIAV